MLMKNKTVPFVFIIFVTFSPPSQRSNRIHIEKSSDENRVDDADDDAQNAAAQHVPRMMLVVADPRQTRIEGEHEAEELKKRHEKRRRPFLLPRQNSRLQIKRVKRHRLKREARVTRQEAQPHVLHGLEQLRLVVKEVLVARTLVVLDVDVQVVAIFTADFRPVGTTDVEEMRP